MIMRRKVSREDIKQRDFNKNYGLDNEEFQKAFEENPPTKGSRSNHQKCMDLAKAFKCSPKKLRLLERKLRWIRTKERIKFVGWCLGVVFFFVTMFAWGFVL